MSSAAASSASIALAVASAGAALAQPLAFVVPVTDNAEWKRLPEKQRTKIQLTLRVLEQAHSLRSQGNWVAATDSLGKLCSAARGLSGPRIRAKYAEFVASYGDWRVLRDNYKAPSQQPVEFQKHIRKLAEENHRSIGEALDKLRQAWAAGQPVPGYGTWMEWYLREFPARPLPSAFPRKYPAGWSVSNLRRYGPKKAERMLHLRGLAASHGLFPRVKRDPSHLRPLELIVIDDFELDVMCAFRGDANNKPQLAYVCGLMAIDVGCRKKLAWGIGPRLEREEPQADGTIKRIRTGVQAVSVQGLIYQLIERHGLPDYQVTVLCENATASISAELELMLSTLFDGRIRVDRTSMLEHHTLANGFIEHGGAPWEKGWVESEFNKLWNMLADQPGYKGSNQRLNAPAGLDSAIRYTQILLGQGERQLNLPAEQIARLKLPFKSKEELEGALAAVIQRSELRTAHRLLGFDRVTEFRLEAGEAPRAFDQLALLTAEQQATVELLERMESPAERWERLSLANPRTPIAPDDLAVMLLTPKNVTWRNFACTFVHQGNGYTYVDPEGDQVTTYADGTEFLGYFDPERPAVLHLAKLTGEYAGALHLLGDNARGVDIRDAERLKEVRGMRAKIINRAQAEVAERHADQQAVQADMLATNAAIIAPHLENLPAQTRKVLRETAVGACPQQSTAEAATALRLAGEARTAKRLQATRERAANALQDASELDPTNLF